MATGIKETKEVVDAVFAAVDAVKLAKADGKIDLMDLGLLLPLLPKVEAAALGIDQVVPELKDLDATEAAELVSHVMSKLSVLEPEAKIKIEKALLAAKALHDLYKAFQ